MRASIPAGGANVTDGGVEVSDAEAGGDDDGDVSAGCVEYAPSPSPTTGDGGIDAS